MSVGHVAIAHAVNQARGRLFLKCHGTLDICFRLIITWRRFCVEVDGVDLLKREKNTQAQFERQKTPETEAAIPSGDSAARGAPCHADRRDNFSDDVHAGQACCNKAKPCTWHPSKSPCCSHNRTHVYTGCCRINKHDVSVQGFTSARRIGRRDRFKSQPSSSPSEMHTTATS